MMRPVNVLLVGPWSPSSLAFARSMRQQGIGVYLLQATAQHRTRWSFSALQGATTIAPRSVGTQAGIDAIRKYAADVGASALVATVDAELIWLGEHRQEFEPTCRVLVQSPESLRKLQGKCFQTELARAAGMRVLPTHLLTRPGDVDRIPETDFPVVLRPDRPDDVEPGFKVRLAASQQELRSILNECRRIDSPIIAQPFRSLPNLVVHGARSASGDVIGSQCYLVPRKFEGITLSIEPQPFPAGLEEPCHDFARRAGIVGCYHLEFLFSPHEHRTYFLEVNVRLGGTTDKVVRTGYDEPLLLLESHAVVPRGSSSAVAHPRRIVNKRTVLKHLASAVLGKLTPLDYPDAGRLRHMAESCRDLVAAKDSIFDWRDVAGSIRFHFRT